MALSDRKGERRISLEKRGGSVAKVRLRGKGG